eukprot:11227963-Lingulodinium_polyedra.AAC.1
MQWKEWTEKSKRKGERFFPPARRRQIDREESGGFDQFFRRHGHRPPVKAYVDGGTGEADR